MVREARTSHQQIRSLLLRHRVAEPTGPGYRAKTAIEALRRLKLLLELQFAPDVMLDELAHAKQKVKRVIDRLGVHGQPYRVAA